MNKARLISRIEEQRIDNREKRENGRREKRMDGEMLEIKVPGSTANLGPGFDTLGLAIPLYLTIRVKLADTFQIIVKGEHLSSLPTDRSNLIYRSMEQLYELAGKSIPPLSLEIESEIPLSRGLGSSGSAIIAGLLAANELLGQIKTKDELLQIAAKIEGHSDNIGASLYGGFIIAGGNPELAIVEKLPYPEEMKLLLLIPKYTLSTNVARKQIPERIPLKDASQNIGNTALLAHYFATGQIEKIPLVMKDKLHQPYRQNVVKGLERILYYAEQKHFAAALSGAGPTIILFLRDFEVPYIAEIANEVAEIEGVELDLKLVTIQKEGPLIHRIENPTPTCN